MESKGKKIGWVSLGCPKNLVDSEVMLGHLVDQGFQITRSEEDADILVVNTCGFIEPATAESIRTILEMAGKKSQGSCQKLIVTGCLVERYRDRILKEIPEVDAVLGVNELESIVQVCDSNGSPPQETAPEHRRDLYLYDDRSPRVLTTPGHFAYIKIAEGCDHTCAFCIIPALRGVHRSRAMDSIVREAGDLAARGVKEINIISQDTTRYGQDLGLQHGLARLMEKLVRVEGIEWHRVMYSYPNSLDMAYLEVMAREPRIARYLDLPLQHASGSILKAMRRGGDRGILEDLLGRVREKVPEIVLRTTMIVGFPGETERDFRVLLDFCRQAEFDHLGVFAYCDEEGTPASALKPKIPKRVAQERRKLLMAQQARISKARNRRRIGKTVKVLVECISEESEFIVQGRAAWQAPEIDGAILITDSDVGALQPGQFYEVRITRALEHDLIGRVVNPSPA